MKCIRYLIIFLIIIILMDNAKILFTYQEGLSNYSHGYITKMLQLCTSY